MAGKEVTGKSRVPWAGNRRYGYGDTHHQNEHLKVQLVVQVRYRCPYSANSPTYPWLKICLQLLSHADVQVTEGCKKMVRVLTEISDRGFQSLLIFFPSLRFVGPPKFNSFKTPYLF